MDRRARTAAAFQLFVKLYGRTARRRGLDANDRRYDRELEAHAKRMPPADLDALLREGEP